MKTVPHIPENAPFSREQRSWLNGYLAGMYSVAAVDGVPGGMAGVETAAPPTPVTILYGSQTGTAEGVAREAADRLEQTGCLPTVFDMDDYEATSLADEGHLLVVCSTYGDGEMPDNAQAFWTALSAEDAPRLEEMNFSVLALGDTSYETYCTAGKEIDARLEALGATRLHDRIDCDVDFEEPFEVWIAGVTDRIGSSNGSSDKNVKGTDSLTETNDKPTWTKKNPYPAKLKINRLLSADGSSKETRHYEIDLGDSGITYTVGDALQVQPVNCPELVTSIIKVLGVEDASAFRETLTVGKEICTPSKDFLAAVVERLGDETLAEKVSDADFLYGKTVIDFLEDFPGVVFGAEEFLDLLRPLQPRAYSISSSLAAHPGEVHLTIASVRFKSNGRSKKGVCSCFLADRAEDTDVLVWVHANKAFAVPADADVPMIMVGPGTGIAPFRAFLEERAVTKSGGKNWLLFGDRNEASDFLYRDELEVWKEGGLLNRLDLAWSRDQEEKIYVQDRMRESGAELYAWLEDGAYFFVCGDAYRMAKDVDKALLEIVAEHGGMSEPEAEAYIAALRKAKRYVRDVY